MVARSEPGSPVRGADWGEEPQAGCCSTLPHHATEYDSLLGGPATKQPALPNCVKAPCRDNTLHRCLGTTELYEWSQI